MGNFEKLSVLVIVVIIVMILVVALYTWTGKPKDTQEELASGTANAVVVPPPGPDTRQADPWPDPDEFWEKQDEADDGPKGDTPAPDPIPTPDPDPVPSPDPAPAPEEGDGIWEYTIQDGDTISQICERELGSWRRQKEVMKLNPDLNPLTIRAGQVIKMPPRKMAASPTPAGPQASSLVVHARPTGSIARGDWYIVQRGDRLSSIAKRAYGSIERWPELWARNLSVVKDPDALDGGERIYIPK